MRGNVVNWEGDTLPRERCSETIDQSMTVSTTEAGQLLPPIHVAVHCGLTRTRLQLHDVLQVCI